jgi:hypothetical protein
VPVAHACNSSYSGGSDQEDHGTKPAWANSSKDLSKKKKKERKKSQKRADGVAQGVGLEFKLQHHKNKNKPVKLFSKGSHFWHLCNQSDSFR